MSEHHLKTWPEYFKAISLGEKTFEVRVNDRNFQPGDTLILEEYEPNLKAYTGRSITCKVGYVLNGGEFGLPLNMVVMSLLSVSGGKFMDELHRLADMAERLNALIMRLYPQAWGKDLVKTTGEYIDHLQTDLRDMNTLRQNAVDYSKQMEQIIKGCGFKLYYDSYSNRTGLEGHGTIYLPTKDGEE